MVICDEVDRKCWVFIWCSIDEECKMYLVKWDIILKLKFIGGLGIWFMW